MRKSALILLSSFFFNASFAQSYAEPLNTLKTYMQSVEKLLVTNMEVKDNYLYIYSYGDIYEKINLKKLGAAVANKEKKFVVMHCLNSADCEYSSISKSKSNMLMFLDHNDGVCEKLPALFNDFISAYDKESGIAYVPPVVPDDAGIPEIKPIGFGEILYADNAPVPGECPNPGAVRVYNMGNSSIRINDSKDTLSNTEKLSWLENSAMAFSDNEQELYFRHPTDNYYQVWNIAGKKKTAEITFNEAGNTPEGRRIMSSFPNIPYPKDTYLNTSIWISEDLNISFDKNDQFTISSLQNLPRQTFAINLRGYAFESNFVDYERFVKKVPLTNIKFYFNFYKSTNKLFIIITGDQITKDKSYYPYCGVYSYNLTTGSKDELMENINCQTVYGENYKDRWYFSKNALVHAYVRDPSLLFRQFSLAYVSKKDLVYSCARPNWITGAGYPNGWYMQYIGSDSSGNPYLCKPVNNDVLIRKHTGKGSCSWEPVVNILHSTNRRNTVQRREVETLNVMAVSPSGKLFAYLNLHNLYDGGNIASIMLYNDAEKDRVYTLNDQTKYSPNIAKNYITDKESEALALSWKNEIDAARDKRLALYKGRVDSLKAKIGETENMLAATYQHDIELAKQKKYGELLAGKKWVGYKTYINTITYAGDNGGPGKVINAEFKIQEEMEFIARGEGLDAKIEETLTLPRAVKATDGDLILKDKDVPDNSYSMNDYSSVKYIRSSCSAPLYEFRWPEFKLGNTPYIACYGNIKGDEVIKDSRYYKKFTDLFMNFLWKCNFKFFLSEGSLKITLMATGKDGTVMGLDYEKTAAQLDIENKRNTLVKQLSDLEKFIEKGN